ncbi:aspartate aminotransferase family protein [Maribacter sp. 2-571]|uniref:aspartate aminotransferase family protein n=1 Tax=Maribacter sp. 2-571 TaxID=3417569 RepID=UPI003D32D9B4
MNLSKFHLSEQANISTPQVLGCKSIILLSFQQKIEGRIFSYLKNMPISIKRPKGSIIKDVDGNHFIDSFSGCDVLNVGHCNEQHVFEYVSSQHKELIHALGFPTDNKVNLIVEILAHLPNEIQSQYKIVFGGPTGSDAVETVIKLAKIKIGRSGVLAFSGGYYGMTSGAHAVSSDTAFMGRITLLIPDVHFVPYGYCYRCPFDKEANSFDIDCVKHFERLQENLHSGIKTPAAIIIEPLQGEGRNMLPKEVYPKKIVVIFDETQSDFLRAASFLEFMNTEAIPNIITFSEEFGGIGFPLSGLIYRKDIEAWTSGAHIDTFRGNQVSIVVARGAFSFIEKYNIIKHISDISSYLFEKLEKLKDQPPFIGDVRARGMMIGVEFVLDKFSKRPYSQFLKTIRASCFQRGLLFEVRGLYYNVMHIIPLLITTHKITDRAKGIMRLSTEESMWQFEELKVY